MNAIKIQNKQTGEVSNAIYARNRLGNLRYWVGNTESGRFYSDKEFDKKYKIINTNAE